MEKNLLLCMHLLFFVPVSFIVSCKKAYESPWEKISHYKIRTIDVGNNNSVSFTYNALGDPISGTRPGGAATGAPNLLFEYDKHHRLVNYAGVFANGIAGQFRHIYTYANEWSENIILDTLYTFVNSVTGPRPTDYLALTTFKYKYDAENRIIQISWNVHGVRDTLVRNFTYGPDGDLVGWVYDNKVNYNLTSKIFAFLNNSYSRHNPFRAAAYNSVGLPTLLGGVEGSETIYFLDIILQTARIEYTYQ
jgi:hypothetical protein